MKIDFDKILNTLDGNPIIKSPDNKEFVTLKWIAIEALMNVYQDEQNLSGEEKIKRYKLAVRITNDNIIDIDVDEISLIKKLIGKAYSPLVVGQCWDILEGNNV